jgi:hypothetical protein
VNVELVEVAQELYGLLPGEFIAARNAYAKEAKTEDKQLAQRIQQLRKPSAAAWVVNVLVRHRHEQMTQLLDVGASLRQAQANLDAGALRELTKQRRRLVSAVTANGRALAVELGEMVSDSVARQVEDTLTAAMMDEAAAAAVRSGLLIEPLVASGIGSVDVSGSVADPSLMGELDERFVVADKPGRRAADQAASAGRGGGAEEDEQAGRLVAVPEPDPEAARAEALAAARDRLAEAREAAGKADRKRDKAEKRVSRLEARSLQVQAEIEELKRRLVDLEHQGETVEAELEEAEEKRERAVERAEQAAGVVQEAQTDVDRLGG